MTTRTTDGLGTITLKNREYIDLPKPSLGMGDPIIRHFGVSLDNIEAQAYIKMGLRVFCDEGGPYLVVRLRNTQNWPFIWNRKSVDVVIKPLTWWVGSESGITCWLERIEGDTQ